MPSKASIYSAGKMRVLNIPGLGSYDLVSGLGYSAGDYGKSSWAFACMNIRANALAQIPWRLMKKDKVVESHPVIDLLQQLGSEGMKATEIDMCLKGAGYWLRDKDRLTRLNPNTMQVKRGSEGIAAFIQTLDGKPKTFELEEIVYFREFHPTDDLGPGVPVIEVAKQAILAEYESARYIKSFFENDAIPGLLLSTEQPVDQKEMSKLKAWWDANFRGATKKHKVAFVDKGLKAQILSTDLRSMALEEIRDQARRDICTASQVPMLLVGYMDESNYANAREAQLYFMEGFVIPRADYYADCINAQLVQVIDPNVTFEFATDELALLQEDKDALAERLGKMLDRGAISAEFMRSELGIPETAAPPEKPEPEPIEAPEEPNGSPELAQWQRKATKALRAGKSANVPFDAFTIPVGMQASIRANLSEATTPEDIMAIFSRPQVKGTNRKAVIDALSTIVDTVRTEPVITVNVPEQPAPIVNVAAPIVNVPAPIVNVNVPEQPAPIFDVNVNVPEQPAPNVTVEVPRLVSTKEEQRVHRDKKGQIDGTTGESTYQYEE